MVMALERKKLTINEIVNIQVVENNPIVLWKEDAEFCAAATVIK
jgi:hypothetical protein